MAEQAVVGTLKRGAKSPAEMLHLGKYLCRYGEIALFRSQRHGGADNAIRISLPEEVQPGEDRWEELREFYVAWAEAAGWPEAHNRDLTTHIFVSYPPGTDEDAALAAALDFGYEVFESGEFGGHWDYLAAFHTDRDHPHMHFQVLRRDVEDPHNWLKASRRSEHFNSQNLRNAAVRTALPHGIEMEATTRAERGVEAEQLPHWYYYRLVRGQFPDFHLVVDVDAHEQDTPPSTRSGTPVADRPGAAGPAQGQAQGGASEEARLDEEQARIQRNYQEALARQEEARRRAREEQEEAQRGHRDGANPGGAYHDLSEPVDNIYDATPPRQLGPNEGGGGAGGVGDGVDGPETPGAQGDAGAARRQQGRAPAQGNELNGAAGQPDGASGGPDREDGAADNQQARASAQGDEINRGPAQRGDDAMNIDQAQPDGARGEPVRERRAGATTRSATRALQLEQARAERDRLADMLNQGVMTRTAMREAEQRLRKAQQRVQELEAANRSWHSRGSTVQGDQGGPSRRKTPRGVEQVEAAIDGPENNAQGGGGASGSGSMEVDQDQAADARARRVVAEPQSAAARVTRATERRRAAEQAALQREQELAEARATWSRLSEEFEERQRQQTFTRTAERQAREQIDQARQRLDELERQTQPDREAGRAEAEAAGPSRRRTPRGVEPVEAEQSAQPQRRGRRGGSGGRSGGARGSSGREH